MPIIKKIATEISENGGASFFVGGAVRDELLGLPINDFDIEVFGIEEADFINILEGYGDVIYVGKSFGVYKLQNYPEYDFALSRIEKKTGPLHTDFEVVLDKDLSLIDAARRRDFTCNAIMKNVLTNELHDFFNGIDDIRKKRLVHINDCTFVEDPLRGLRACQLASRFSFEIAPSTKELIQKMTYTQLSYERLIMEYEKGFSSIDPAYFLDLLKELSFLHVLLPELDVITNEAFSTTKNLIAQTPITSQDYLIIRYVCLSYFVSDSATFLQKITHSKKQSIEIKRYLKALNILATIDELSADRSLRIIKNIVPSIQTFFELADVFSVVLPETFLNTIASTSVLQERYSLAISNNPLETKLISGKDLIQLGYVPNTLFSSIIDYAYQLELNGWSKEKIKEEIPKQFPL